MRPSFHNVATLCVTIFEISPVDAPSDRAFTTWPTVWMPPSAMTGTPKRLAYSATLYTEVPWGRPHAMTRRKKKTHPKTNIFSITVVETNQVRQIRTWEVQKLHAKVQSCMNSLACLTETFWVHVLWLQHVSSILVGECDPVWARKAGPHSNSDRGLGRSPWQLGVVSGCLLPRATDSLFFLL